MVRQRTLGSEIAVRLLGAGETMSDHVHDNLIPGMPNQDFSYPWAAAPDIIRSNQKDAYFQTQLLSHLSSVLRSLYGARTAHAWTNEARTFTELLYLGLTTFVGNRTLGEEYCDIVQVEDDTRRLPSAARRAGYIIANVLLPYALSHFLPALRRRLRAKLEASLRKSHRRRASSPSRSRRPQSRVHHIQEYILRHLDTLTAPAPVYALSLTLFYFGGAYYHLSKRLFGLRYVFTRQLAPSDQRAGYEVLGVLLVLQLAVQAYVHAHATYQDVQTANLPTSVTGAAAAAGGGVGSGGVVDADDVDLALDAEAAFAAPLLFDAPHAATDDPAAHRAHLARITHTPLLAPNAHRVDLSDESSMQWIAGTQQRKCTLCLEAMKDPAATTCGHAFCWSCITDWLREQPMCPLCRQNALVQHVLPLKG